MVVETIATDTGLRARPGPAAPRSPAATMAAGAARVVVVGAALVPIVTYLYVALHQLGYPYELEWMEGGAAQIVARVAHGQAVYVAPSLHYVPYTYTPLYFYVAGALAKVTGLSFLPLRLVSLIASLGCLGVLFRLAWRETGDPVAGVVAAGFFAATFEVGGAWLDIGRVDSLLLLFMLLAVWAARRARDWPAGIGVGLLVFAAFFTKQTGLVALVPLLAYLAVTRWRAGVAALGTVAVGVAGSTALLQATSHGWYGYYIYSELAHQPEDPSVWVHFLPGDIGSPVGFAVGLGLLGLVLGIWRHAGTTSWAFWIVTTAGFVGASFVSRLHTGGGNEVLIPAYAAVALLGGLGYDAVRRAGGGRPALVGAALALVVVAQVVRLSDHPSHLIPTAADVAAGRQFVAMVARTPGEVIVLNHPWYDTMAGKASWAQGEAVHDIVRSGPSTARTDLVRSIDATLASPEVTAIYFDYDELGVFAGPVHRSFRPGSRVFSCFACFFPPTDVAFRPYLLYVRR